MKRFFKTVLPTVLSVLALIVAFTALRPIDANGRPRLGVTNFDSIHLSDANGTATPNLQARQNGTGVIAEFKDGATTVARFPNGGGFDLLVGALSADGGLDLDGNLSSGTGALTITDNVLIDGAADAVQLTVQGFTTQTNNILTLEQSDGTDVLQVTNAGNIDTEGTADVEGTLTVTGAAALKSTLDTTGNGTFSADLTVDDTFNIDDTDSALTGAQTITPTYSYLQVSPATVLTITLGVPAGCDGDILIIHNLVTTSTTVIDTGATQGGGAITLGQDDPAGFICGDGVWVELFSPDNS